MTTVYLHGGPCEGHYDTDLDLHAPPALLTAVVAIDGTTAVLDLPDELPLLGDEAHEYDLSGVLHVTTRADGHRPRAGVCRRTLIYEHPFTMMAERQASREAVRDMEVRRGRAHPRGPAGTVAPIR